MASVTYSGHIDANDGFSQPAPFAGPPGWTVYKMQQTEIFKVTHNLNLTNPKKQLHIVVTPCTSGILPAVTSHTANDFTITMLTAQNAAAQTDFSFVAIYYRKGHG